MLTGTLPASLAPRLAQLSSLDLGTNQLDMSSPGSVAPTICPAACGATGYSDCRGTVTDGQANGACSYPLTDAALCPASTLTATCAAWTAPASAASAAANTSAAALLAPPAPGACGLPTCQATCPGNWTPQTGYPPAVVQACVTAEVGNCANPCYAELATAAFASANPIACGFLSQTFLIQSGLPAAVLETYLSCAAYLYSAAATDAGSTAPPPSAPAQCPVTLTATQAHFMPAAAACTANVRRARAGAPLPCRTANAHFWLTLAVDPPPCARSSLCDTCLQAVAQPFMQNGVLSVAVLSACLVAYIPQLARFTHSRALAPLSPPHHHTCRAEGYLGPPAATPLSAVPPPRVRAVATAGRGGPAHADVQPLPEELLLLPAAAAVAATAAAGVGFQRRHVPCGPRGRSRRRHWRRRWRRSAAGGCGGCGALAAADRARTRGSVLRHEAVGGKERDAPVHRAQ